MSRSWQIKEGHTYKAVTITKDENALETPAQDECNLTITAKNHVPNNTASDVNHEIWCK